MNKPVRRRLRIGFLKWHRALGLAAAAFVILLVVTGIALNHTHELALDSHPAPSSVLPMYGIELRPPAFGYKVDGQWLLEYQETLFFNDQAIGNCSPPLVGAVAVSEGIMAFCQNNVFLLTSKGQLIERAGDVPEPLQRISQSDDQLLIAGQFHSYRFDSVAFSWLKLPDENRIADDLKPVNHFEMPNQLAQQVVMQAGGNSITWERFILDLHSGRLFGEWGVWFVDIVAVCLALLAISGVWLRLSRPGRKH